MKNRNLAALCFALIIATITSTFGWLWIDGNSKTQIKRIDQQLQSDAVTVRNLKTNQTTVALSLVRENPLQIALAFQAADGTFTLIRESTAEINRPLTTKELKASSAQSLSLNLGSNNRIRSVTLTNGDHLIFAANQESIHDTSNRDRKFLLLVDLLFGLLMYFLTRFIWDRNQVRKLEVQVASEIATKDRMQSFLGDASHELRTPLTVIKGYLELLQSYPNIEKVDSIKYIDRAFSEATRMESLIRDLLLLAELGESASLEVEPFNIAEVIEGFVTDLQTLQPERSVIFESENPIIYLGSEKLITQLVSNIISNASRHTEVSAPVKISLHQDATHLDIDYDDGGGKLPETFFESEAIQFSRFDKSRSRETGGSGLGLSIMKSIVMAHGGEISLSRSSLGGLHIHIELPRG